MEWREVSVGCLSVGALVAGCLKAGRAGGASDGLTYAQKGPKKNQQPSVP